MEDGCESEGRTNGGSWLKGGRGRGDEEGGKSVGGEEIKHSGEAANEQFSLSVYHSVHLSESAQMHSELFVDVKEDAFSAGESDSPLAGGDERELRRPR